jgi:hypothetical protein
VRGVRRLAAGLLATGLLILLTLPAAHARPGQDLPGPPEEAAPEVDLLVERFDGVLLPEEGLGLRVRVRNRSDTELDDLRLVATLHRRSTSRFDFQQAVDEGRVGIAIHPFAVNVDPLGPSRSQAVDLEQTAAQMGFARPADKYGVYPLRLQLQQFGDVLAEIVTAVVLSPPPEQVERPVRATLLVPLDAAPSRQPDGTFHPGRLFPALGLNGRLQELVRSVGEHPDVPVTVATSPLVLEQAADLRDGYTASSDPATELDERSPGARRAQRFLQLTAEALGGEAVEHVALPYGPADLVALVRGGLGADAPRMISHGRTVADEVTGVRPARRILWPPDGLDRQTLAQVLGADVDTVVLSERYLAISGTRELPFSPAPVRRLRAPTGGSITALVPDPWLEEVLARDSARQDLELVVQRVLAETAATYFERPYADVTRGLLLAPPQLWDPAPDLPGRLLAAFDAAPWLAPSSATTLRAAVAPEPDAVQLDYPQAARVRELPTSYIGELRSARRALEGLTGVLEEPEDGPAGFAEMLEIAASVHYRRPPLAVEGRQLLRSVQATVADIYGAVAVEETLPVLLSSIEGQVPVTVRNDAEVPLRVRLRLETQRYEFDGGPVTDPCTICGGETLTRAFHVRALAPGGTHQIRVVVEDGEGLAALAEGTVVVRSTAVSLTALVVTAGAGLFLAVWWIRESSRRRAARQDARPRVPTPVG